LFKKSPLIPLFQRGKLPKLLSLTPMPTRGEGAFHYFLF
jgi:hypothetical protein